MSVMHGLGKLHEDDFNLPPCRLVASVVGLSSFRISLWVDEHLKVLLHYYKTYVKNSEHVLHRLKSLREFIVIIA